MWHEIEHDYTPPSYVINNVEVHTPYSFWIIEEREHAQLYTKYLN